MADTNITQWNLTRLAFAWEKDGGGWDAPVEHPGVINLNISNNSNDSNRQAADGGLYYDAGGSSSKSGELQVAKFLTDFLVNALGQIEEGGGIGEGDGVKRRFAMLFEISGDQGGARYVWYFCTAGPISVTFATNDADGNVTFSPETSTITGAKAVLPNGNRRSAWSCAQGSENYDNFFTAVFFPETEENPEP
jgi:phi13 family phage major tail protein